MNLIRFNQLVTALILLSVFNVAVTNFDISQVSASTQNTTEILVGYVDRVNVDATDTFKIYIGVYDLSQGFIGNKNIEYYHIDTPQFRRNVTTDPNQLTVVSWELSNWPGFHTIYISYENQIIPVSVIASNNTSIGSGQADFNAVFENNFPSVGADNNASVNLFVPGVPFLQLDGSEIFTVETTALISGQSHNLVLGYGEGISGFYFDPFNAIIGFSTPIWSQVGSSLPLQINFSGNSLYASLTKNYSLPVRAQGQDLSISLPSGMNGGDRSNFGETTNTVDLSVELAGDSPNGTVLDIKFQLPGYSETTWVSNYKLTNFISIVSFSIPYDQPLGNGILVAEISRNSVILDHQELNFEVFDELAVSISFSSDILIPNESVDLLVYTYREDTYLPEPAIVTIFSDVSLSNPIINLTTGLNGQATTSYVIPNSLEIGIQNWYVTIEPLANSSYKGQIVVWPVNLFAETLIEVNSDIYLLNRGENITLTAQVSTSSGLVNEGTLALVSQDTETIIIEYDLSAVTEVSYLFEVDQDFPKGISYYRWEYSGTDVFSASEYSVGVYVYSHPIFQYTTLNQSYTLPGDSVLIHGYLLQDDTQRSLLDNTTSIELWEINSSGDFFLDTFETTETGEFSYEYFVPSETAIGIYTYQLRFDGDEDLFLRSSQNQPLLELQVRAEKGLAWQIPDGSEFILGGESLDMTVFGRPNLNYELAYITDELLKNDSWLLLAEIDMKDADQQDITLDLPDIYGPITLRLLEVESGSFEFYPMVLYIQPDVNLQMSESPILTYDSAELLIESSEPFRFRYDGSYVYSSQEYFEEQFLWEYNFTDPGDHIIYVETIGSNLAQHVFEFPIVVYESVNIEFLTSINSTIPEGSYPLLSFKITNNDGIPLPNIHAQLVSCFTCIDGFDSVDQVLAESFTSISGEFTIQPQIIGQHFAISLPGHESRYILPMIQELSLSTIQVLKLEADLNEFQITEGTSTDLIFKIKFQYSDGAPSNVPIRISIVNQEDSSNIIPDINLVTNKDGEISINIGKGLEVGSYLIGITSEDSRFQPLSVDYTLHVIPAPSTLDMIIPNLWLLPVGGTGILGLAMIGNKLRKRVQT